MSSALTRATSVVAATADQTNMSTEDPKALLHRLNNQLGVILAHAELLETKAQDAAQKARASQVVNAALQAMAVSRELRDKVGQK